MLAGSSYAELRKPWFDMLLSMGSSFDADFFFSKQIGVAIAKNSKSVLDCHHFYHLSLLFETDRFDDRFIFQDEFAI